MAYRKRYKSNKYAGQYHLKLREFSDIETSTSKNTVMRIGVSGTEIGARCAPFLQSFKYFKVNNIKLSFLPASTLPADPSQISYEAGENSVNPTDMMNVGLMRFTNGENMSWVKDFTATQDTTTADTEEMQMYYNLMLDNRWGKFAMQKGFKTVGRPLIWDDGLPAQFIAPDNIISVFEKYPTETNNIDIQGKVVNIGASTNLGATPAAKAIPYPGVYPSGDDVFTHNMPTKNLWRVQTGKFKRLGWRPCDECIENISVYNRSTSPESVDVGSYAKGFNTFPFIDILTVILPRAIKTKFAFRIVSTISVSFAGPVYHDYYGSVNARKVIDRSLYPQPSFPTQPHPIPGTGVGAFVQSGGQ